MSEPGPHDIERVAQTRMAIAASALLEPVLTRAKAQAVRRVFARLDRGETLEAIEALGCVLELYAVEKLERELRKSVRRGRMEEPTPLPDVQEAAGRS